MNIREIKAALGDIYEELMNTPSGVSWNEMWQRFNNTYPEARHETGADLYDSLGHRLSKEIISGRDRAGQERLPLANGWGDIAATITCTDGEGGYRRKRIAFASVSDIIEDEQIQTSNLDAARESHRLSEHTKAVLVPVMEDHGFELAGAAIEWLSRSAPS